MQPLPALPRVVRDFLERLDAQRATPLVLHLDPELQLLDCWGDTADFGLVIPAPGASVADTLPFLIGLDTSVPHTLLRIDPGSGHPVNVHLIPGAARQFFVVITSAAEEARQLRELQQTANEMRLLNHRQQRLVDQLVAAKSELELRRREAEEAVRVKAQFLASMSHEFRTPLTSVIGYAEWLTAALEDDATARSHARAIVRSGRHMIALVDNILEQARMDNTRVTVRRDSVDLRDMAADLAGVMAPLAADKGIAFAVTVEPPEVSLVVLDEMRVRQIFINLLGNAVKFTENGFVQLALRWADEILVVEVADSGPGIAPADQERIFSPYERLEETGERAGAGLGLHITLQLVRLLSGTVTLDSRPGEGSTFRITLPAPVASRAPDNAAARPGADLVIAENDPDIVALLRLFLTRAGYRLRFAANGREAVELVAGDAPDLVLLDLHMPVLDGLAAVGELRAAGYAGPVVALTGATLDAERIDAIAAGFDGYVAKPVRMPDLLATLDDLLGN